MGIRTTEGGEGEEMTHVAQSQECPIGISEKPCVPWTRKYQFPTWQDQKPKRERERHRESLGQFHFPAFPCSWCNLAIPPPPIAVVGIATAKENGNTLNFRSLSLLPLGV